MNTLRNPSYTPSIEHASSDSRIPQLTVQLQIPDNNNDTPAELTTQTTMTHAMPTTNQMTRDITALHGRYFKGSPPTTTNHIQDIVCDSVVEQTTKYTQLVVNDNHDSYGETNVPPGKQPESFNESMEVFDILRNMEITSSRKDTEPCKPDNVSSCKVFVPIGYSDAKVIDSLCNGNNTSQRINEQSLEDDDSPTVIDALYDQHNTSYDVIADVAMNGFSSPLSSIAHLSPRSGNVCTPRRRTPIDIEVDKAIHKTVKQVLCLHNFGSNDSLHNCNDTSEHTPSLDIERQTLCSNNESAFDLYTDSDQDHISSSLESSITSEHMLIPTNDTEVSTPESDELMNLLEFITKSGSQMRDELNEAYVRELTLQQEQSLDYDYTQCLLTKLAQENAAVQNENTQLNAELHVLKAAADEGVKCHQSTLERFQLKQQQLILQLEKTSNKTTDACTITDIKGNGFDKLSTVVQNDKCVNTERVNDYIYDMLDEQPVGHSLEQSSSNDLSERDRAKVLALEAVSIRLTKKLEDAEKHKAVLQHSLTLPLRTSETQTIQCVDLTTNTTDNKKNMFVDASTITSSHCKNTTVELRDLPQMNTISTSLCVSTQTQLIQFTDKAMLAVEETPHVSVTTQTESAIVNTCISPVIQPINNAYLKINKTSFAIHKECQTYTHTWDKVTQTKSNELKTFKHQDIMTDLCSQNMSIQMHSDIVSSPRHHNVATVCRVDSSITSDAKSSDSGFLSSVSGTSDSGVQTELHQPLTPNITQEDLDILLKAKEKEAEHTTEVAKLKGELAETTKHIAKLVANHNKTNIEMDSVRDNLVQLQIALVQSEKENKSLRYKVQRDSANNNQMDTLLQDNGDLKRTVNDLIEKLQRVERHVTSQVKIISQMK